MLCGDVLDCHEDSERDTRVDASEVEVSGFVWELTALPWPVSPEHPDTCRMLGECDDMCRR